MRNIKALLVAVAALGALSARAQPGPYTIIRGSGVVTNVAGSDYTISSSGGPTNASLNVFTTNNVGQHGILAADVGTMAYAPTNNFAALADKNNFTGSTNNFAGTINQTGGGVGLQLSGALVFTSLGGNINDADGATRIGMQKSTIGGLITIYDTNGTPAVTFGKNGNLTNTLMFQTAAERITTPGSAASVVNLALDANFNVVTNASPVGAGGGGGAWSTTIATGNENANGFQLNNLDTLSGTNITAELVTFGRTAATGGRFNGDIGILATNGFLGEIGFNFDGHTTSPNLPVQGGISIFATNTGTGVSGQPVASFSGKRSLFETHVTVTNTYGQATNLFEVKGSSGDFIVASDGTAAGKIRITPRLTSIASSATPAVNSDASDCVNITALAVAITSMTTSLTGTPNDFDQLEYRIKDNGTARAITWGASFVAGPAALPTTTIISKALHVYFEWDAAQSKWVCMSTGSDS
jgi:hypothetical protein